VVWRGMVQSSTKIDKSIVSIFSLSKNRRIGADFDRPSPEALGKIREVLLSVAFGIRQFHHHHRARFPRDFAGGVQVPHCIAALFEIVQNFRKQLAFGAIAGFPFSLFICDVDPKP
jgi:hypothetical protein